MLTSLITPALIAVTCALFALLVRLDTGCNLASEERHRQWAMPVVAIVYGCVLVWRFDSISQMLSALYQFAADCIPLISQIDQHCIVVCVFNLLAMLVFIIGKRVALAIVNRTSESGQSSILSPIYNIAYYYDREESKWLLRVRYSELRKAVRWVHRAATLLALCLLVASLSYPESILFTNPFYPVFLPLILGEVRYFFEGMNVTEYRELMGVDPDEAERVRDFLALQRSAAEAFPNRFLESHLRNERQVKAVTSEEYVDALKASAIYEERLAGEYVGAVYAAMVDFFSGGDQKLDAKGSTDRSETARQGSKNSVFFHDADFADTFKIEADQVQAMVKLLRRQNVIFATPFFHDFREFFFFPVNRALMQGDKVLVLDCQGDLGLASERWVNAGLHAASSVYGLWSCGDLYASRKPDQLDVGILSAFHLNDFAFLEERRGFLSKVGFVIILHPSSMVSVTQIGFARLTHLMRDPADITYAAFDVNADGLVDSLSHAARSQFVEVAAMPSPGLLNCGIHWSAEGEGLHLEMFDDVSRYLGMGTELGTFSLRMGVESIEWSSHAAVPLKDIRWISNQYFRNITTYAEIEHAQSALEQSLKMHCGLWGTPIREHGFYIVEDEICNLLEVQRQYSTRGTASSFVNVISGNYLLRDFMRFNERVFLSDARTLSLVVADFQRSLRNYLIELLATLIQQDVSVIEVRDRLRVLGIDLEADQVFAYCVGSQKNPGKIDEYGLVPDGRAYACVGLRTEDSFDEETQKATQIDYLYVYEGEPREELIDFTSYLRYAFYIAEDEVEYDRHLGSCLFGQVHQRYLPGQFTTVQGKYYEVLSITPDSGMLLRRAGDHFERRAYYRQVKSYTIGCCHDVVDDMSGPYFEGLAGVGEAMLRKRIIEHGSSLIEIAMITADVEVRTLGYLNMVDYADVDGSSFVSLDDDTVRPRRYVQKNVLRLVFEGASDIQLVTIAALLNELMRTMYACDYEYISVVPALREAIGDYKEFGLRGVVQPLAPYWNDETVISPALYVIEDSIVDIGLVSSFERNAERFLAIVQRFLSWHYHMLDKGPVLDRESRHFIEPEQLLGDVDRFAGDPRFTVRKKGSRRPLVAIDEPDEISFEVPPMNEPTPESDDEAEAEAGAGFRIDFGSAAEQESLPDVEPWQESELEPEAGEVSAAEPIPEEVLESEFEDEFGMTLIAEELEPASELEPGFEAELGLELKREDECRKEGRQEADFESESESVTGQESESSSALDSEAEVTDQVDLQGDELFFPLVDQPAGDALTDASDEG